jgi:ABC-type transport system involved in multi-copper enzyme maturation permease subunit
MSTAAITRPRSAPAGRVTQGNVVRSEWTKLWTLRSTRWSLLAAVVAQGLLGILIAAVQMNRWDTLSPHDRATYDAINTSVAGFNLSQLAIGVLGVMIITGEYSTGMIRSSFMAVPRRLPVLWAKIGVFSAITFALMLVSSLISFFVVQAIVAGHGLDHSLGDPPALRVVVGAALFITVLGILATGIGALARNTAGGIALFVFLLFVLPGITGLLPASIADSVGQYLPLSAGSAIATSTFEDPHHLSPWGGFAVFCAYAVIAVGAAAIGLRRRDA